MRVLVLSAHTDDAELGAGATIAKLAERGDELLHVVFSFCGNPGHLEEFYSANGALGIPRGMNEIVNLEHRVFPEIRQTILEYLYSLGKRYAPELVLCPYLGDIHQDHQTVAQEAVRAFGRGTSIWMYELPYNCPDFKPTVFIPLGQEQVQKKLDALRCYGSMVHEPYFNQNVIRALMTVRGLQCESTFAEAFHGFRTRQVI